MNSASPVVGIVMGSSSDWDTMKAAAQILAEFGVPHEAQVVSAHRMPDDMFAYAEAAQPRGLQAIIAGAGGAAHLPGMLAAKTVVPVLGVPVASRHLQGVDSLHSIVQMPKGHSGGHLRHRHGRRGQRGAVRRGHAGQPRRRAARQAASLPRRADRGRPRHDPGPQMSTTDAGRPPLLLPGATLGVLGGGQLGRMFVHAAQSMGYATAVLDPDPDQPGRPGVADHHILAPTTSTPPA